jgi:hypothetical protein
MFERSVEELPTRIDRGCRACARSADEKEKCGGEAADATSVHRKYLYCGPLSSLND